MDFTSLYETSKPIIVATGLKILGAIASTSSDAC